jgi:hypothetical protein
MRLRSFLKKAIGNAVPYDWTEWMFWEALEVDCGLWSHSAVSHDLELV